MSKFKSSESSPSDIHIYFTSFNRDQVDSSFFNEEIKTLPSIIQKHILAYNKKEDRLASLLGNLLLKDWLTRYSTIALEAIQYDKYSKPVLHGINFNISHSGEFVVCALSLTCEVGIDIERVRPVPFNEYNELMRPSEWETIKQSESAERAFFRIWTIKESIAKAEGKGLSISFQDIIVDIGGVKLDEKLWHWKEIPIHEEYMATLATDYKDATFSVARKTFSIV